MIITVQGYNGKKNRSTYAISALAGMSALTTNNKHLVIQLVDNDIESVEGLYNDMTFRRDTYSQNLNDKGIDSILANTFKGTKLIKSDFEYYATCFFPQNENRLDILEITQSPFFVNSLDTKIDELTLLLTSANEVYDYVYVLLPSLASTYKNQLSGDTKSRSQIQSVLDTINTELAEYSVYCLEQGHTLKQDDVKGNNIVYLIPQYDEDSVFTLKSVKRNIANKKDKVCKIAYNRRAYDAALKGEFINFIKINKKNDENDSNFIWMKDIKNILEEFYGIQDLDTLNVEEWDKIEDKPSMTLISTDLFPEPMVADPPITGRKFLGFHLKDKPAPEKAGVVFTLDDLKQDETKPRKKLEKKQEKVIDSKEEREVIASEQTKRKVRKQEVNEESPVMTSNKTKVDAKAGYKKVIEKDIPPVIIDDSVFEDEPEVEEYSETEMLHITGELVEIGESSNNESDMEETLAEEENTEEEFVEEDDYFDEEDEVINEDYNEDYIKSFKPVAKEIPTTKPAEEKTDDISLQDMQAQLVELQKMMAAFSNNIMRAANKETDKDTV